MCRHFKEMGKPDHMTCLLRNLYAGQEATVRTGHGTMDWFKIGKGVNQSCILSPWLFNLYGEYIMWNAELDEAQAGIKILGRNINNLSYADDITFIAESKSSEVKLLSRVRLFATPWTVAHQAPPLMGFSRQEYWSGLPFPSPGDLLDPGIEPASLECPTLAGGFFTTVPPGKPNKEAELPSNMPLALTLCLL